MSLEIDVDDGAGAPVWAAFGDLMSVLLGVFVLILVSVIGVQLHLEVQLQEEIAQRRAEEQRRQALEDALAAPLAAGRITLVDGRIGIRGNVLFALNSARLRQIRGDNRRFADNWELSAQRALTVTRALVEHGVPASSVFAAAFGAEQPVASNSDEAGRARNRRVEMAPVPRQQPAAHGG